MEVNLLQQTDILCLDPTAQLPRWGDHRVINSCCNLAERQRRPQAGPNRSIFHEHHVHASVGGVMSHICLWLNVSLANCRWVWEFQLVLFKYHITEVEIAPNSIHNTVLLTCWWNHPKTWSLSDILRHVCIITHMTLCPGYRLMHELQVRCSMAEKTSC